MPSEPLPTESATNLNLRRRPLPGLLALAVLSPLRPVLALLRRPAPPEAPVAVFASYMVGDLYMALPALKMLARARATLILCRPDCAGLLAREGLNVLPFDNAFLARRTPGGFLRTWKTAWALRHASANGRSGAVASLAFDLDASPLSALWLRLAGIARVVSYRRDFGLLFDETFTLPRGAVHQADRDMAVVEYALAGREGGRWMVDGGKHKGDGEEKTDNTEYETDPTSNPSVQLPPNDHAFSSPPLTVRRPPSTVSLQSGPWLLSVWTRKPSKNWPLEKWDEFLEGLIGRGVECALLRAPDGDEDYRRFCARWEGRVGFVAGSLDEVADAVRNAAGVVATDNFLGHMAGYHGKPVVWINMVSPAAQVMPRGPRTIEVAPATASGAPEVTVEAVRRAFDAARRG